jgi:hypothetical protein
MLAGLKNWKKLSGMVTFIHSVPLKRFRKSLPASANRKTVAGANMELQEEIKLLEKKLELLKQIQEIQVKLNEAVKYVPVYPTFPTFPQPEPYHYEPYRITYGTTCEAFV